MFRIVGLLSRSGQPLRPRCRNADCRIWRAGLLWRIQFCHLCGIQLQASAQIFYLNCVRDVPDDALAVVRPSVSASCVLPLLFIFRRHRFSARRNRRRDAVFY